MWKAKCQTCEWTSGDSYLHSVAQTIGKLHEEDNKGHKVVMREVSTFGGGDDEEENPTPHKPEPSKP